MLKNYLNVALRTLMRQKGYAAINVLGLAAGIACCVFLLLYVRDELSYDRFIDDAESVYRVNLFEEGATIALTPTIVAPLLKREFPEVAAVTRLEASGGLFRVGNEVYDEDNLFYADSTFFKVMTLPLISGDPTTALVRPYTVVLTQSTARKFFGDGDPIGRRIIRNNSQEYEVTGVMADLPPNSHLHIDLLASFASREYWASRDMWGSANFYTYVRLGNKNQLPALERKVAERIEELRASGEEPRTLVFQSMPAIHLSSGVEYEIDTSGNMAYVYGFATLAVLILLMACVNYMNLATARSALRAREVGMRKSLGAFRGQLVGQFYGEAILMTVVAAVFGYGFVLLGLPWFNSLSGKSLTTAALFSGPAILLALGVFVVVTLVAGSYPALFLSGIEPMRALRGRQKTAVGAETLRKGLVVLQFGISSFLIVGALTVLHQIRFMQNKNLGFDKEHVVEIPMNDPALYQSYDALRAEAENTSAISHVSAMNQIPGQLGWTSRMRREGMSEGEEISVKGMPADPRIGQTLGLQLVAGRFFADSPPEPDSVNYEFVLNETAARILGWTPTEAVGSIMEVPPRRGEVIGVVKDFNFNSLHVAIEPLAIWYDMDQIRHVVARIEPGQNEAAIAHLKATWERFAPDMPFSFRFIDDVYNRQYANERRIGRVVTVFAGLAILIACLGLLGLASFTAEKRRREIGVRKVLGASVSGIVGLLSREFLQLVGIAFVVAAPVTWMLLHRWLSGFADRVTPGPAVFSLAAIGILLFALLTVSLQAVRAATADPVRALRDQ